jgi:carboxypeptidase Taq
MNAFENFSTHLAKIADVAFSASVLSWDQETYMPEKGAEKRGRQISTLAGIQHELATGDTMEKLLKEVLKDNELKDWQKKCITIVEEDFLKNKKYSKEFVEELSLCISRAFQKWQEAKVKKDFSVFAPELKKLVELKKSECEILGYKNHPYNALLNEHEKGMSI